MLTCRELFEFLHDYLARDLSLAQRASFELHLTVCKHCREYLATYKKTIDLTCAACEPDDDVPEDVPEDLVQAILNARRSK